VVRLLGYAAIAQDEPNRLLRSVLDGVDKRLEVSSTDSPVSVEAAEAVRSEVDWLVAAAREIVEADGR